MSLTCELVMDRPRAATARFTTANLVFITSGTYTIQRLRDLGSGATTAEKMVSGADQACKNHALSAKLPGKYMA